MTNFHLAFNDIQPNGKTTRENNLQISQVLPLYSYVEIFNLPEYPSYEGKRMFIVRHSRDCDGTPLYDLCTERYPNQFSETENHFPEECLKLVNNEKAEHCHILEKSYSKDHREFFIISNTLYQWIVTPNDDITLPQYIMDEVMRYADDKTLNEWKTNQPYTNSTGLPIYRAQQLRASFIYGLEFSSLEEAQHHALNENIILQHHFIMSAPVIPGLHWE